MTSESSEPDEQVKADLAWHREMDMNAFWDDTTEFFRSRALDDLVRVSEDAGLYDEFDDEPTHEKWRRGAKWR
jgi:hypothetical protein